MAQFVTSIHTTPKQAGKIFSAINPGLAVYYHTLNNEETVDELLSATREIYSGELIVGNDLMVIEIGESINCSLPESQ